MMGKENYAFALTDDLCKQYYAYKDGIEYDKEIVNKLLKFRLNEFITNVDQLSRISENGTHEKLINNLRRAGLKGQSLEELAQKTVYKLILSNNQSDYPYLNINDDNIEVSIIGCFYRDIQRRKAISHINCLCKKATTIAIYDKYINKNNTYEVLFSIIPDKVITLEYMKGQLENNQITEINNRLTSIHLIEKTNMLTHHDRYIIIDDKIEIILSSGFEFLSNMSKEISYIIRPIKKNRLYDGGLF